MPRTSNAARNYEPFTKRPVVMAAMRRNSEYLGSAVDQQNLLVADVASEFSIDKLCERNALGQIRAAGWGLFLRHVFTLCNAAALPSDRHTEEFLTGRGIFLVALMLSISSELARSTAQVAAVACSVAGFLLMGVDGRFIGHLVYQFGIAVKVQTKPRSAIQMQAYDFAVHRASL